MLPPLTDLVALLGISLVLSAGCLRLLSWRRESPGATRWAKWVTAVFLMTLWYPAGSAHLPLVSFVRGISSDLSITLVALACLGMCHRLFGRLDSPAPVPDARERNVLQGAVSLAAVFLYPLALGWGDWDAYRAGWAAGPAAPGLWLALLVLSLGCWVKGFRLLPLLVGLALLAWCWGLLESTNLWDYLMDPWLAVASLFQCIRQGVMQLRARFGKVTFRAAHLLP